MGAPNRTKQDKTNQDKTRQDEAKQGRAVPEFIPRVGARIRVLRRARGWTVQQLSDAAEVSRRMLTQIELGQANPSLVTIDRIARALGTDFATLAQPEPSAAAASGPIVDPTPVWSDEHGGRASLLGTTATAGTVAELWRWTLAPGTRYDAQPDRPGAREIHHVASGTLTVETEHGPIVLAAGDTAVIHGGQHYAYLNTGAADAVFYRVVTGA